MKLLLFCKSYKLIGLNQNSDAVLASWTQGLTFQLRIVTIAHIVGIHERNSLEHVAQVHGVAEDVLLLAATGKLKDNARKWFDLNICTLIESWPVFKTSFLRRFKRTILFHVAMEKVKARKWNYLKESFQDYAMDKLVLIKNLRVPDIDAIHLLINGIGSRSLREVAATLRVSSVDEFLEEMHQITLASGEPSRKPVSASHKPKKAKSPIGSPKKDRIQQKETKDIVCVYCHAKGHLRADWFKLKRKEQAQPVVAPAATAPISAVSEDVSTAQSSPMSSSTSQTVAIV
ncbi:uncharacterized protein [Temnothorax longispinosus]|uniref:uncharacterized protein n=1 Tax=Temnothorax longispinosus TaxID=300112 RepID=UPI003A98F103